MSKISSFRELLVWQKAMDLAVRSHNLARSFPKSDDFVLGHQIRKSAISIPSNIAEGFSRHSTASYIQHLWIAHASGAELETQVELGRRLRLAGEEEANTLTAHAQEIGRMINGLVAALEKRPLIPDS